MVELLPTSPREQTLLLSGKPGIFARIPVKGMRVVFLSCRSFAFVVNKQLLVPVFIMFMCLNSYPEPEQADDLWMTRKKAMEGDPGLLIPCGKEWIIKYLQQNNRLHYRFSTNPHP
jgi:hypothetical protein